MKKLWPTIVGGWIFWAIAFVTWAALLWWLSDGPVPVQEGPEIPHLDKVLHFGYFFGGGGLLSATLYRLSASTFQKWYILPLSLLILGSIGALDEWHQSWIPERSGNDPMDWLADLLGNLAGSLVFRALRAPFDKACGLPQSMTSEHQGTMEG